MIPFVADFGLAKRLDVVGDLTGTGLTPGTPRYMAPEQAAGRKDLTVAADVYSLGVVLYERLTGATPFGGDDLLELLRQVREVEATKPSNLVPGLDHDLETVRLKCLEKSPEKRYATAEALADDLALAAGGANRGPPGRHVRPLHPLVPPQSGSSRFDRRRGGVAFGRDGDLNGIWRARPSAAAAG